MHSLSLTQQGDLLASGGMKSFLALEIYAVLRVGSDGIRLWYMKNQLQFRVPANPKLQQRQVHDPESVEPPGHPLSAEHHVHAEHAVDGTAGNVSWQMRRQMVAHQSRSHPRVNSILRSSTYAY